MNNKEYLLDSVLLAAKANTFNDIYFHLHDLLVSEGDSVGSRNGDTKEFLAFKTEVLKPNYRCVGGHRRNMNVFFLLAEALWIWAGRKDVEFLDIYNSQLKQYSDDGKSYHAAYGFRLRNFGLHAKDELNENKESIDQIQNAISMLHADSADRRVVMQIWNADMDLGTKSKDLPCNDLLMYKVRNGKLHTTISNRSNDVNLGLTTNIFQFSFVSEIISKILGVEMGSQVHNSDSLHAYLDFDVTKHMLNRPPEIGNVYDYCAPMEMDFNFSTVDPLERLQEVDFHIRSIIAVLSRAAKDDELDEDTMEYISVVLPTFSKYLYTIFFILKTYVMYKNKKMDRKATLLHLTNYQRAEAQHEVAGHDKSDYLWMAMNFIASRMTDEERSQYYRTYNNQDLGLM